MNISARIVERLRRLLLPASGRHRSVGVPAAAVPVPVPAPDCVPAAACDADPPTLQLPRIPVGERFPIPWDTDPVGAYVIQYERQRALEAAR